MPGPPDDVCPPPFNQDSVRQVRWGYGTNGQKTFPTLGWVILEDGKFSFGRGPNPESPVPAVIGNVELVEKLRALHALSTDKLVNDPLVLIRAVNLLHPLGRGKSLAAIEDFCWVTDRDSTWISWLLRALFVGKPLTSEVFGTGFLGVRKVPHPAAFPRNPVFLIDDIPFCFSRFGASSGPPYSPLFELDHFKENGVLRDSPLRPPADPFLSYRKLQKTAAWRMAVPKDGAHYSSYYTKHAFIQVLNLCRTVVPAPLRLSGCNFKDEQVTWHHRRVLKNGLRWDAEQQLYVRKDGTFIPFEAMQANLSRP